MNERFTLRYVKVWADLHKLDGFCKEPGLEGRPSYGVWNSLKEPVLGFLQTHKEPFMADP